MKKSLLKLAAVSMLTVALTACSNMSHREKNVASGAGIGALGGAAVSGLAGGSVGTGALVGAGVGAVGGYLYDKDRHDH